MDKLLEVGGEVAALPPENLVENNNWRKLGTDGLRGRAEVDGTDGLRDKAEIEITEDIAERYGYAHAMTTDTWFVIVGRDPRLSGPALQEAVMRGAAAAGKQVIDVGVLPTPGVAFLSKTLKRASGVVVTASHNPPEDNGIKSFDSEGAKFDEDTNKRFEEYLNLDRDKRVPSQRQGEILRLHAEELKLKYQNYLIGSVEPNLLAGKRVLIDAANGAASEVSLNVVEALGGTPIPFANNPKGDNINVNCGAEHPEFAAKAVEEQQADIGIVYDGDSDRVHLVSPSGAVLEGDHIMLVNALAARERGELKSNTVVGTIMSNMGTQLAFEKEGITFVRADVGDAKVAQEMRDTGAEIGGENSGHITLAKYGKTGDGLLVGLQTIQSLNELDMTLDEAVELIKEFPQTHLKAVMPTKEIRDRIGKDPELLELVSATETEYNERGEACRIIFRASGTQDFVRVTVEMKKGKEDLALELAEMLEDAALEKAWPSDIQEVSEMTYGNERFKVRVGRNQKLVRKITKMAREGYMERMVPGDSGRRFKNRASFEEWYEKGRFAVTWEDEKGELAKLIWHGKSSLEKELAGLREKGAVINFVAPEGCDDTFAIRIPKLHRKKPRGEGEDMSFARRGMEIAQRLYEQEQEAAGAPVNRIWLETNLFDETGTRVNDAVHLYAKAGYKILGIYDNPDPTNPEKRVVMVTGPKTWEGVSLDQLAAMAIART